MKTTRDTKKPEHKIITNFPRSILSLTAGKDFPGRSITAVFLTKLSYRSKSVSLILLMTLRNLMANGEAISNI